MKKNMFKVFVLFLMVFTVTICFNHDNVSAATKTKSSSGKKKTVKKDHPQAYWEGVDLWDLMNSDQGYLTGVLLNMADPVGAVCAVFDMFSEDSYLERIPNMCAALSNAFIDYQHPEYADLIRIKAIETFHRFASDPTKLWIDYIYNVNNEVIGFAMATSGYDYNGYNLAVSQGRVDLLPKLGNIYLYDLTVKKVQIKRMLATPITFTFGYPISGEAKSYYTIAEAVFDHKELFQAIIAGTFVYGGNDSPALWNEPKSESQLETERAAYIATLNLSSQIRLQLEDFVKKCSLNGEYITQKEAARRLGIDYISYLKQIVIDAGYSLDSEYGRLILNDAYKD